MSGSYWLLTPIPLLWVGTPPLDYEYDTVSWRPFREIEIYYQGKFMGLIHLCHYVVQMITSCCNPVWLGLWVDLKPWILLAFNLICEQGFKRHNLIIDDGLDKYNGLEFYMNEASLTAVYDSERGNYGRQLIQIIPIT